MKRLSSFILALIMTVTVLSYAPTYIFAATQGEIDIIENPLHRKSSVPDVSIKRLNKSSTVLKYGDSLKGALINRKSTFVYYVGGGYLSENRLSDDMTELLYYCLLGDYSEASVDGDYIYYNLAGANGGYTYDYEKGAYKVVLSFSYYDTAAEEEAVNKNIRSFFSKYNVNDYSDYEMLKIIHDYIIDSCEYNYNDMENNYNYSAYGALIKGKAVCQGYALAFYRLAKEAGFDVRIAVSDEKGNHAWNVVRLGGKSYFVDCTWDDNDDEAADDSEKYLYFLVDYTSLRAYDKGTEHTLDNEIHGEDSDFVNNYQNVMSDSSWDDNSSDISNCTVSISSESPVSVTVKDSSGNILSPSYYTVSQSGDYLAVVTGKNGYSGYCTKRGTISTSSLVLGQASYTYTGAAVIPSSSLSNANLQNYILFCDDNINAGTVSVKAYGTGKYTGFTDSRVFVINPKPIENENIYLESTTEYYTGGEQRPNVYITGLSEYDDYTVEYVNNVQAGTAYVYVTGIGNYSGTAVKAFEIIKPDIADKNISISKASFEYTGSEIKPSVSIAGCVEGVDYTVSYSSNINVGTGYVTVQGIGYYGGSKTISFEITAPLPSQQAPLESSSKPQNTSKSNKPKKVTLKSLKTSKKSITVSWKKVTCTGYQIEYSTNKNFKKSKKVFVKKSKTTSKKISKLKKGKKYYVRVRAYKTTNGKKVYGSWSSKKSIKCK